MEKSFLSKTKDWLMGHSSSKDMLADELQEDAVDTYKDETGSRNLLEKDSSVLDALIGPVGGLGDYHFPADLIGGCCPRIVGEEQGIVWNAAAEASDTERVHVVWQTKGDKIWYLAVRSSDMSSYVNTWCPFASLLPGMKDAADPPIVYTYFSDESATMMSVLVDGLQIHRGTSSVIRAKAERMSREYEEAPIVELIPDRISSLVPVPWFSASLFEERSRRILATVSVLGAIAFSAVAVFVWLLSAMSTVSFHADLKEITHQSEAKSLALMKSVQTQRTSPMREQIAKFSDINDELLALSGYLDIYEILNNKTRWRAIVPTNVTSDRIRDMGGQTLDSNDLGVVIGNNKDALSIGKVQGKKK